MADETGIVAGRDERGRFGPGNVCSRGTPAQRAVALLRTRAIKFFKSDPNRLQRYLDTLEDLATDKEQPGVVRVAAIKELLSRALGKADQTINVNTAVGKQMAVADPAEYGRRALALGIPWDKLPPEVQAVTARPIVAVVSDKEKP